MQKLLKILKTGILGKTIYKGFKKAFLSKQKLV